MFSATCEAARLRYRVLKPIEDGILIPGWFVFVT